MWEGNDHRYELMQRIKLWRFVSGQPNYDVGERFLRRIEYRPNNPKGSVFTVLLPKSDGRKSERDYTTNGKE